VNGEATLGGGLAAGYGRAMTTPPEEPVNAAEEDPTVTSGDSSDTHGVASGDDASVAARLVTEDDLPERNEDEAVVGLGPTD